MAAIPNRVVLGDLDAPILTFYNSEIEDIVEETAVSPIGDELFIDQFYPTVRYGLIVKYYFVPADFSVYDRLVSADGYTLVSRYNYDLRNVPYGTPIRFFSDGIMRGLFYVNKVERLGRELFKIDCVSAIGLMDKQKHFGDIYQGKSFPDVLEEITGGQFDYDIAPDVATLQVFGHLNYRSRRYNLHQLLVAYGVTITKSDAGKMLFTFLNPTTFEDIETSRIFNGGSVEYGEPASRVELTEHSYYYLNTVDYKDLFDTQAEAVEHITVTFDEPIYPDSLETEGEITIHQAGVNYAIISGVGILRGQPYVHNTKLLVKNNPDAVTEKIVTVDEATLITLANSENALERISNYYFHATKVTQDIVVDDEKTGRRYRFDNPFMEKNVGVLSRMSVNTSSFRRAECDFIAGYTPLAQGSSFLHRQLLELTSASTTWEIPQSVREKDVQNIRLVLIGKGNSGQPGQNGQNGQNAPSDTTPGDGGLGGEGGIGGDGGKVLSVTVDASHLAWISYWTDGINTYVQAGDTLYTSANGFSSPSGFTDLFTGAVYALPGHNGQSGAPGGKGGYNPPIGGNVIVAENGADLVNADGVTRKGGKGKAKSIIHDNTENGHWYVGGGGGGGASADEDGHDAENKAFSSEYYDHEMHRFIPPREGDDDITEDGAPVGGTGADGGDAAPTPALYGTGGNGGNGGGGGGGGGIALTWNYVYDLIITVFPCYGGTGGVGGNGADGYRGCLLIYY